tara:strand:+ start:5990 stop:7897 length:1908 start_codon:yes stop_codon:yes gene_type:complete
VTSSILDNARQCELRKKLWAAHRTWLDRCWDAQGQYIWDGTINSKSYRVKLCHCLAYLDGDANSIDKANRIIQTHFSDEPCHFTPSAIVDLLHWHRDRLEIPIRSLLENNLRILLPYMLTDDLKIQGYNDNHPYKAMHALILGGQMLGDESMINRGLDKLQQACDFFTHAGFPCEYNSPSYTFVSLAPLAGIAHHAHNPQARDLALKLERFYWQDLALHFDQRVGLPTGPFSRGYDADYEGLLASVVMLLAYLFPDEFEFDLHEELYKKGAQSTIIPPFAKSMLPCFQARIIFASAANYHLTPELINALFGTRDHVTIRGTIESGVTNITWPDATNRPAGAPDAHRMGPRRSLITTWFGKHASLGTAQYAWLDNKQAHGCIANITRENRRHPSANARYFTRFFHDDNCPYVYPTSLTKCFEDQGEIRTVQHEATAMVFYNPMPIKRHVTRLRTGIFRPIRFHEPQEIRVGNTRLTNFNTCFATPQPIAINEGAAYVGIIPMRLTDHGQSHNAALEIMTRGDHLSILISSLQSWSPIAMTYQQLVETNSGFVMETHDAQDFASFDAFCQMLNTAELDDQWYASMRTTTYCREGLKLSSCYSPWQSAFRHVTIQGKVLSAQLLEISGIDDPGCDLCS